MRGVSSITCLALISLAFQVTAAEAGYNLDIPSQELNAALQKFALVSRHKLLYKSEMVEGRTSPALKGEFTTEQALKMLLEGTSLTFDITPSAVVLIRDRSSGDAAAPATSEDGDDQLEEVVVTATKRAERLLDVPMSMSVLTASDIGKRGLVDGEDYLRGMPSVAQVESGLYGHTIVIRGLATELVNFTVTTGSTVSTYFGEVPTTYSFGIGGTDVDLKLVDIQRIEVLKGPQGTSFGASSLGGSVRTIPTAPKLDLFEGHVGSGYSLTTGTGGPGHMLQGMLNLPLIEDKVAVRGVIYDYRDSGYYRNDSGSNPAFLAAALANGAEPYVHDVKRVGDTSVTGGRLSLLYQATDRLKFTLGYVRQLRSLYGSPKENIESGSPYTQLIIGVAPEHIVTGIAGGSKSYVNIINPVLEYDLGWSDLLATYSYTKGGSTLSYADSDGGISPWPSSWWGPSTFRESVGEVRLATKLDAPVNFLTGVFYGDNPHDDRILDWRWYGDLGADPFGFGVRQIFYSQDYRKMTQKAAFAEAGWQFAPRLKLTVGARYYDYDRTVRLISDGPLFGGHQDDTHRATASGTTWKGNLTFKPSDDSTIYASWAEGFRQGKPQAELPASTCDVDNDGIIDGSNIPLATTGSVNSDTVESSELGIKFAMLEHRLSVDAAVFRVNWNEMPIGIGAGSCPLVFTANAGKARSQGVEFQASYRLTDRFTADLGASWVDAKLIKDAPAAGGFAGDRLPGTPKVNGTLGLQYGFTLVDRDASVRADTTYIGPSYSTLQALPTDRQGDYVKVDLRGHMDFNNKIGVDLYVRNLFDDDSFTMRGNLYSVGGWRLQPRTFGLQVGYDF